MISMAVFGVKSVFLISMGTMIVGVWTFRKVTHNGLNVMLGLFIAFSAALTLWLGIHALLSSMVEVRDSADLAENLGLGALVLAILSGGALGAGIGKLLWTGN